MVVFGKKTKIPPKFQTPPNSNTTKVGGETYAKSGGARFARATPFWVSPTLVVFDFGGAWNFGGMFVFFPNTTKFKHHLAPLSKRLSKRLQHSKTSLDFQIISDFPECENVHLPSVNFVACPVWSICRVAASLRSANSPAARLVRQLVKRALFRI